MNAYSPYDVNLIIGLVVMNFAYALNDSPPSSASNWKLPAKWTNKKIIRKRPVSDMISFLPIELVSVSVSQLI
jgi:hypothetical protein